MAQTQHEKKKTVDHSMGMQNADVVDVILEDHKPLKKLIKTLKGDAEFEEKFVAFEEFAPLLIMHAQPEEETVYVVMKKNEECREEGFEGDVEHQLADQLIEEIKRTKDEDLWMARVKVLAELVEHHIEEEEDELLPKFKENFEKEERVALTKKFFELKQKLGDQQGEDSPSEASLELLKGKRSTRSEDYTH